MKMMGYAVAILVAICAINSVSNAQSVVDLAKRERERQKNLESKSTLTRETPRGVPTVTTTTTAATATPSPATPATPAAAAAAQPQVPLQVPPGPTDNKGRNEKYWRSTFEKARQELKRAEDKVTLLQLKSNDLNSQLLRESIHTREMEIRADLDKNYNELFIANRELADAKQRITDLEEELRRSGGYPGWAR